MSKLWKNQQKMFFNAIMQRKRTPTGVFYGRPAGENGKEKRGQPGRGNARCFLRLQSEMFPILRYVCKISVFVKQLPVRVGKVFRRSPAVFCPVIFCGSAAAWRSVFRLRIHANRRFLTLCRKGRRFRSCRRPKIRKLRFRPQTKGNIPRQGRGIFLF